MVVPKTGVICCGTAETAKCCGLVVGDEDEVVEGVEVGGDESDDEAD